MNATDQTLNAFSRQFDFYHDEYRKWKRLQSKHPRKSDRVLLELRMRLDQLHRDVIKWRKQNEQ